MVAMQLGAKAMQKHEQRKEHFYCGIISLSVDKVNPTSLPHAKKAPQSIQPATAHLLSTS